MSLWNRLTRPLINQWHRFHAWRATRLYAQVAAEGARLERKLHKADRLTAKHVYPPEEQLPLPLEKKDRR
jgi:hypothetical protein